MNKRVYGVIGIKSIMGNWNADFSGYPKSVSSGEVFGSDKALKFPMKKMWQEQGEKIIYIRSMKMDKTDLRPRSLKERYEYVFEIPDLKKEKDTGKVLTNLFSALDVRSFGATFAEEGNNISITGAVQIGQGFNKYEDTVAEEQQILSPFRDGSNAKKGKEEANSTTLGTKIVSDEAHYMYPFTINPKVYQEFIELGVTEGYTEEDYKKFKEAALMSATAFNTNAKVGCENELAVFVETEPNAYLPDLAQYVKFEKGEKKNTIVLGFDKLLEEMKSSIKEVSVYYNPHTTNINCKLEWVNYYNLFTKEEA